MNDIDGDRIVFWFLCPFFDLACTSTAAGSDLQAGDVNPGDAVCTRRPENSAGSTSGAHRPPSRSAETGFTSPCRIYIDVTAIGTCARVGNRQLANCSQSTPSVSLSPPTPATLSVSPH